MALPDTAALMSLYDRFMGQYEDSPAKTQFAWCVCAAISANCEPTKIRQVAADIYDGLETQLSGKGKAEAVKK